MEHALREMKQFTAKKILEEIKNSSKESRKEWILVPIAIGKKAPTHRDFQQEG